MVSLLCCSRRHQRSGIKPRQVHPLERVDKETKRRTNVVGIFPNRAAVIRRVCAFMPEQNDEWAASRRSLPAEKLTTICNDTTEPATIAAQ